MPSRNPPEEQLVLYLVVAAVGSIPVVLVVADRGDFGTNETIGILMLVLALIGLFGMWRVARRNRGK